MSEVGQTGTVSALFTAASLALLRLELLGIINQ